MPRRNNKISNSSFFNHYCAVGLATLISLTPFFIPTAHAKSQSEKSDTAAWQKSLPSENLGSYFSKEEDAKVVVAFIGKPGMAKPAINALKQNLQKASGVDAVSSCADEFDEDVEDNDVVDKCKSEDFNFVLLVRYHQENGEEELIATVYDTDGNFVSGFTAKQGEAIESAPDTSEGVSVELMESIAEDGKQGSDSDDSEEMLRKKLYVTGTNRRFRISQGRKHFRTRLSSAEFYQVVDRPDLASVSKRRRAGTITGRVVEPIFYSLGGIFLFNALSISFDGSDLLSRPKDNATPSLVAGTSFLVSGIAMLIARKTVWQKEPVSLSTAKSMAGDYNEKIRVKEETDDE